MFSSNGDPVGENADRSVELFVYENDGASLRQLTHGADPNGLCEYLDVSDDGQTIVFESTADLTGANPDGSREIFRVFLDGSGLLQLTDGAAGTQSIAPQVSGDGSAVAFDSDADFFGTAGGGPDVYRIGIDGFGLTQISSSVPGSCFGAEISQDGDLVLYVSDEDPFGTNADGRAELFSFRVSTGQLKQVTDFSGAAVISMFDDGRGAVRLASGDSRAAITTNEPIFEEDPDSPYYVYSVDVETGVIDRLSALRPSFNVTGIAIDRAATRVAFITRGDLTESNPGGYQPQIWLADDLEPWRTEVVPGSELILEWNYARSPIRYDSVRGDVASLRFAGDGSVDLGALTCLEDDLPAVIVEQHSDQDDPNPFPGTAFFYLVRGSRGLGDGPGSYGFSSSGAERKPSGTDCAP